MTPEQRQLARHAIGLPNQARRSYRNRFLAAPADARKWGDMVSLGLAERGEKPRGAGATWFWLTRAGAEAAIAKGERLCPEDFPAAG